MVCWGGCSLGCRCCAADRRWSGRKIRIAALAPSATPSVRDPDHDPRPAYRSIYDVSGDAALLPTLISRLQAAADRPRWLLQRPLSFAFAPAFLKARLRVAAEWQPADLQAVCALAASHRLALDGLISHRSPFDQAPAAYARAFADPTVSRCSSTGGLAHDPVPPLARYRRFTNLCAPRPPSSPPPPAPARPSRRRSSPSTAKAASAKSFTLANLSYMMAQQVAKFCSSAAIPRAIPPRCCLAARPARRSSTPRRAAKKPVPRSASATSASSATASSRWSWRSGGRTWLRRTRGIIHGFETLEKLGFHDWGFDFVLLDFLGDVVCGGFGLPIARDMCQKVIVVGSNDLQSLYVANNVCSATPLSQAGWTSAWPASSSTRTMAPAKPAPCRKGRHPGARRHSRDEDIRRKSAKYEIIGRPGSPWAPLFEGSRRNAWPRPPLAPPRSIGTRCSACLRARPSVATSCWSRPRSKIWPGRRLKKRRSQKSSTTRRCEDCHVVQSSQRLRLGRSASDAPAERR